MTEVWFSSVQDGHRTTGALYSEITQGWRLTEPSPSLMMPVVRELWRSRADSEFQPGSNTCHLFCFVLSHAVRQVGSYFPNQGPNPHPLHWKQGVLTISDLPNMSRLLISPWLALATRSLATGATRKWKSLCSWRWRASVQY